MLSPWTAVKHVNSSHGGQMLVLEPSSSRINMKEINHMFILITSINLCFNILKLLKDDTGSQTHTNGTSRHRTGCCIQLHDGYYFPISSDNCKHFSISDKYLPIYIHVHMEEPCSIMTDGVIEQNVSLCACKPPPLVIYPP